MFSEWTDPFDIDNYYGDMDKLFKNAVLNPLPIAASSAAPSKANVPNTAAPAVLPSVTKTESFEVRPNDVVDGRSIGHQPSYNILRSGPPRREPYKERYSDVYYDPGYCRNEYDSTTLFIVLGFLVLLFVLVHLRLQLQQTQMLVGMLLNRQNPLQQTNSFTRDFRRESD